MDQEEKLAYIAGLFDGDGSFTISRRKQKKDNRSCLYKPLIQFGSIDKETCEFIKEEMYGNIHMRKSFLGKDNSFRRDFYFWRLEGNDSCSKFINKISTYLEVKKERAEFMLSYIINNPFIRGGNKLSDEILQEREVYYLKMKGFNDERTFARTIKRQTSKISSDKKFWAYLAGLLDTDGSFSIKKEKPTSKSSKYNPVISLTMTDIRGINKILSNCPFGTVTLIRAKSCKLGACYRWSMHSKKYVSEFITYVIPYLRIKIRQAEEVKKFCDNFTAVNYRHEGIPEEELTFREQCYINVINLNKHGVLKPSLIGLEAQEQGDKAEGESHRDRLSEMDALCVCDSQNTSNSST